MLNTDWTPAVCLSVFFPHDIARTNLNDAASITKLDVEMFPPLVLETHSFWGQKIKGHKAQKQCRRSLALL